MLYDIVTIVRKELKEIFVQRGSLRAGVTNVLIIVGISGILFPLQFGREWITNPIALISVAWMPLFMSMGLVADSFAGERERHTLETLLASRLSDQAILFGKMAASIIYGFGIAVAGMLVGALTINLLYPGAGFYPLGNLLGALLFSLLGTMLVTGIGILVSLHANNVRQAYQRMSIGFMVIWLPLILGPQFMPESWKIAIGGWLANVNGLQVLAFIGVALLAVDITLFWVATLRFQRSQLILD